MATTNVSPRLRKVESYFPRSSRLALAKLSRVPNENTSPFLMVRPTSPSGSVTISRPLTEWVLVSIFVRDPLRQLQCGAIHKSEWRVHAVLGASSLGHLSCPVASEVVVKHQSAVFDVSNEVVIRWSVHIDLIRIGPCTGTFSTAGFTR